MSHHDRRATRAFSREVMGLPLARVEAAHADRGRWSALASVCEVTGVRATR